jgi:hypothetical protein
LRIQEFSDEKANKICIILFTTIDSVCQGNFQRALKNCLSLSSEISGLFQKSPNEMFTNDGNKGLAWE